MIYGKIICMPTHRITVTIPADLAGRLTRAAKNRSRFVAEAIRRELERRRRDALRASLESPHPETAEMAEVGWAEWAGTAADADADLVDPAEGTPVRWSPEKGWVKTSHAPARKRRPRRS
jgi:post-segregation antitoxin (ccd killing protein)